MAVIMQEENTFGNKIIGLFKTGIMNLIKSKKLYKLLITNRFPTIYLTSKSNSK